MMSKSNRELQFVIGGIILLPFLLFVFSSISAKNENKDEKK